MKAAVGLSGGVDSALSAALLQEQDYQITGVFLECFNEPGCRTDQDRKDALAVALKLKIPFRVLNFKKEYRQKVLDIFYREYQAGRTPNPDIACNREIKFGLFLDWALKNKFDYIATGHYAQLGYGSATRNFRRANSCLNGGPSDASLCAPKFALPAPIHLLQSVDKIKDQTYFLALLKQDQLQHVLFPIGHLTKQQVRLEAKKRGLAVWNKKDSSGICFIGHDIKFKDFLQKKIKSHVGMVVDLAGKVIGKHDGAEFYTIGQRWHRPYFVIQKDIKRNRLIVGKKPELAKKEFEVESWNWINLLKGSTLKCRIRHQGGLITCRIQGKKVILSRPEYGIAAGQAAVIYCRSECLGGGIIKI